MQSKTRKSAAKGQDASSAVSADDADTRHVTIFLRALDTTDLVRAREWRNDFTIMRWCRQSDFISDWDQQRWFEKQAADATIRMYAIKVRLPDADDKTKLNYKPPFTAGVCGLTSIDWTARSAEFSLYVGTENHGKGLGSHALHCLLSHGFDNIGLNCIWGEVLEDNPAAKMYDQFGMTNDGTTKDRYFKDGRFWSATRYSIRADEWKVFKDRALTGPNSSSL